jgi:DNA-binding FadR family transcriptional regulator
MEREHPAIYAWVKKVVENKVEEAIRSHTEAYSHEWKRSW